MQGIISDNHVYVEDYPDHSSISKVGDVYV